VEEADGADGLRQPDRRLEVAQVEVEPGTVDRGASDLAQLEREDLGGPVDLGLVAVEGAGELAQLLDVLDERLPDPADEAGGLDRQLRDRVEGAEDGLAVLAQPADEV